MGINFAQYGYKLKQKFVKVYIHKTIKCNLWIAWLLYIQWNICIGMFVFERLLSNITKYYQTLSNIIKFYHNSIK